MTVPFNSVAHRPRGLVLAPAIPRFDRASGDRRFDAMLRLLAEHHEVHLLVEWHDPQVDAKYLERIASFGVHFAGVGRLATLRAMEKQVDWLLVEFYFAARDWIPVFRAAHPDATVIVDSVDLHYLRLQGGGVVGVLDPREALNVEREELSVYRAADLVLVVTTSEQRELATHAIHQTVVIPNIVPSVRRTTRTRGPHAVFVGGFAHAPNRDGILWFNEHVWPIVRQTCQQATCTIVGTDPPDDVIAIDGKNGIEVTGWVPDTTPFLDVALVSIAPLRFGAGMKGKVSEALAAGLPVVSTSFGAQGFEAGVGEVVFVGDTPETFAAALIQLLQDEAHCAKLEARARALADSTCSEFFVRECLTNAFVTGQSFSSAKHDRSAWPRVRIWTVLAWNMARSLPRWIFGRARANSSL